MYLNIKTLRKQKKLSQNELALKIEVSVRMLAEYENETSDIPLKKLQKIAEVLEVSIFELIGGNFEENKTEEPPAVYQLEKSNEVLAQRKTIEILESVVEDLRDDKRLLKNIIENNQGNAKLG